MKTHTDRPTEPLKPYRIEKVDFFVVTAVNGATVGNSMSETIRQNQGRGFALTPVLVSHTISPGPVRLRLRGKTHHPAPILALVRGGEDVEGEVEFNARAEKDYIVKGSLQPHLLSVWVEEVGSGEVVGTKIEKAPR